MATPSVHAMYSSLSQLTLKSASKKFRPAIVRQAVNLIADLVTTGCAKSSVTMTATGKCTFKYCIFFLEHTLANPNTTNHKNTTMGGMSAMVKDHACVGRMLDVRNTQSADSESPIALALATAYI